MRTIDVHTAGFDEAAAALRRSPLQVSPEIEEIVRAIVGRVRADGDAALVELGRRFDCPDLETIEIGADEWDFGCSAVSTDLADCLKRSASNIDRFHRWQLRSSWLDTSEGRTVGQTIRPLDRVGVYVPGGTASYPSTVLMCVVPAVVAGVREVVVCTPCARDGKVPALVLMAARLAGVSRVFKVGGAQAIAAMALGTPSVPAVDKIVGPGNVYVNVAKRMLWGVVDIDMIAGPSEVCVVADETADPAFVAADLLTQAEHDPDCAAYLITTDRELAGRAMGELEVRVARSPRKDILRRALDEHGVVVVAEDLQQAIDLANICAPEHLALMVRDPMASLGAVRNAGAILLGSYSPQTLGDYRAGPSHTLPTSGTARYASPLNVDTFLKKSSFIGYTREALAEAAPDLERLAEAEGFACHAEAVRARFERL